MSQNYFELQSNLEDLQDAFDNETNDSVANDIHQQITDIKELIEDYDLCDDDLFKCEQCNCIKDIEESNSLGNGHLVCNDCNNNH